MSLVMPDPELLAIDALNHYMPPVVVNKVYTTPPVDWAEQMPIVTLSLKGGAPNSHPERINVSDLQIKVFAETRRQASFLIRNLERSFNQACLDHFTNKGLPEVSDPGVLCHVREISPAALEYEGLTSKHPDSVLYSGIFRITSAPILP